MRPGFCGRTVIVILAAGLLPAAGPASTRLSPWQREQLEHGEMLAEMIEVAGEEGREGLVRRVLAAPVERVRRAVRDYAHYAEFMPFVTSSAATTAPAEFELVLDLPWPSPDARFRIAVSETAEAEVWHSRWRLVPDGGDMEQNRGEWTVEPFGKDRSLVTLRLKSRTRSAVPLGLQERATRQSLPWILDGLRQQVGRCRYDEPRKPGCTE